MVKVPTSLNKGVNMKNSRMFQMIFAVALTSGALIGCGKSTQTQIKDSVKDNQAAQSKVEWENSPAHPEVLFEEWRTEAAKDAETAATLQTDICENLSKLDGQGLTLFEEEINSDENVELLSSCKPALKEQLEI